MAGGAGGGGGGGLAGRGGRRVDRALAISAGELHVLLHVFHVHAVAEAHAHAALQRSHRVLSNIHRYK